VQRRDLLIAGGGVLAGAATCSLFADEKPPLQIIDTHTHFYDPTRPQGVPWPSKNNKSLYRPVLPPEYKRLAAPLGVVATVVVEASPWVEDNQWLLDLAAKHTFIAGITGNLDPASAGFEKQLIRFAGNPLYRGIRISQSGLAAGLKQGGKFFDRIAMLAARNLQLDVNGGPDMPLLAARLASKLPRLRIVINHCGNLRIDGRTPPAKWRAGMQSAAKHANVFCKVSALVEQTAQKPAPRSIGYYRPVLDTLWSLFGEDRLIFGSNWPVSNRGAPLQTVVGIVRDYFTAKSKRAAAKYFYRNSQTAYRWRKR